MPLLYKSYYLVVMCQITLYVTLYAQSHHIAVLHDRRHFYITLISITQHTIPHYLTSHSTNTVRSLTCHTLSHHITLLLTQTVTPPDLLLAFPH